MLPPFIIEQIRRREEQEQARREEREQPRLELPVDAHRSPPRPEKKKDEEESERDVIILDLG